MVVPPCRAGGIVKILDLLSLGEVPASPDIPPFRPELAKGRHLLRPEKQNGHTDTMLDLAGGVAEKQIGEEAMPVGAHRHQVATLLLHPPDDFSGRIAIRQLCLGGNAFGLKLGPHFLQVSSVLGDLRTDRIPSVGPGRPSTLPSNSTKAIRPRHLRIWKPPRPTNWVRQE